MRTLTDRDGEVLVKAARLAVSEYLRTGKKIDIPEEVRAGFSYNAGVFVTISKDEKLRGCIGFPTPERRLCQSLLDAAVASATEDPRFLPVDKDEIGMVSFEVTVLTPPEEVRVEDPSQYPSAIRDGRDGLVVKWQYGSGLLLPQVPVEYGWNETEFLYHACQKAGAPGDCWKQKGTIIMRFEGTVFRESFPLGPVVRIRL